MREIQNRIQALDGSVQEDSRVNVGELGLAESVEQFLFLAAVHQGFTQDFTGEYAAFSALAGYPQRFAHFFK